MPQVFGWYDMFYYLIQNVETTTYFAKNEDSCNLFNFFFNQYSVSK